MTLETPGHNDFFNTFSASKQRQLVALLEKAAASQLDLMPPGIVDTTSAAFFLLKAGTSFVYHGPTANIIAIYSKVGTVDTGSTQPTTDVTIDGVSALTAPIANSDTDNTEVVGVLSAVIALVDGDVIELDIIKGTNSDADNMHVVITLEAQ